MLGRALTRVQRIIISELYAQSYKTKTEACRKISRKYKLALSTVKYNYAVLEKAGIVENGKLVCKKIGDLVH